MDKLKEEANYSLWCDFIERDFLENTFQMLIKNKNICGATSNPAIFEQAISNSDAYEQQIDMLHANDVQTIYEEIVVTDIKRAAELLYPLHEKNPEDGFISVEVNPELCFDTSATIEEGKRLYNKIGYENVMIKVPATAEGYEAMETLTSLGISVNATLVFTPEQARKAAEALDNGIRKSPKQTYGVVSIFVSRYDRELDGKLIRLDLKPSQVGIYNATLCYHKIQAFKNENIRTLFASTGVKGDVLPKDYYIKSLVYPHSVNTTPLDTLEAYVNNNTFQVSNVIEEQACIEYFEILRNKGIDIERVSQKLLDNGLEAFKKAFKIMLDKIKFNERLEI